MRDFIFGFIFGAAWMVFVDLLIQELNRVNHNDAITAEFSRCGVTHNCKKEFLKQCDDDEFFKDNVKTCLHVVYQPDLKK